MATATRTKTQRRRVGRAERDPDQTKYAGRVAARIRHLRKKREWTVDELVEHVEHSGMPCSVSQLRKWEAGQRDIPTDALPFVAAAFGMTIKQFLPAE